MTSEGSFMFCFVSFGETKLKANNVLPLKAARLLHSHFLVGSKPVVSQSMTALQSLFVTLGTGHLYRKQHSVKC